MEGGKKTKMKYLRNYFPIEYLQEFRFNFCVSLEIFFPKTYFLLKRQSYLNHALINTRNLNEAFCESEEDEKVINWYSGVARETQKKSPHQPEYWLMCWRFQAFPVRVISILMMKKRQQKAEKILSKLNSFWLLNTQKSINSIASPRPMTYRSGGEVTVTTDTVSRVADAKWIIAWE